LLKEHRYATTQMLHLIFETKKTEELISRYEYWRNLHEDVDNFVKKCLIRSIKEDSIYLTLIL